MRNFKLLMIALIVFCASIVSAQTRYVRSSNGTVYFVDSTTGDTVKVDVTGAKFKITNTEAVFEFTSMTTAQRDALIASNGMVIYNTSLSQMQGYDNGAWVHLGAGAGGGISNVVEDLTPQLGGDLDANAFDIQFDDADGIHDSNDNEQLLFQLTASAVNFLDITNAATGNAPSVTVAGDDADVDLTLDGKGTGVVKTLSSNLDITGNIIVSGTVDGKDIATNAGMINETETLSAAWDLGTPSAGVMTNVTGTAAGLTAGNVTTNANLTGPITSVGNATSIAAQTGTGTTFAMDTSPTFVTPTLGVASATSLATSAATPFIITNGQVVNVAVTSQTVGATTLTIPDFASVTDVFTFNDLAATLTGKTMDDFSNEIDADRIHFEARNSSGATISIGDAVYISGYNVGQDLPEVALADASSSATMDGIGFVESSSIANNANGEIIFKGRLPGVNTSSFSAGDELWVSETGTTGNTLTNTKPTGTALVQKIGIVLRSHASMGVIEAGDQRSNDLPNIASANFWLGNGSGVPAAVTMSGDATMDNAGVVTNSNAATADALSANGTNASAGNAILGVDASGNAEGAFDVIEPSEIDTYSELNTIVADVTLSHSSLTETLTNKTLDDFTNTVMSDGEHVEVYNNSGAGFVKGNLVYISGERVSGVPEVTKADASSSSTMDCIGVVSETIANGDSGDVQVSGTMSGLNTSTLSLNDALYVSETPGASTATKPTGTALVQKMATVSKVHVSLGRIEISGAYRTNDIPNIPSANFWLGNGSGVPTAVTMSSEATMDNAGAVTLADGVTVTNWALGTPASMVGTNLTGTGASFTAGTATVATTVTITDNESTAEENAIVFTAGADPDGGNLGLETDHSGATYNPSTGNISATQFGAIVSGNLLDKSATEAITGSWDFGGATQFEIPNGAAPTAPNVAGEIVFDTNAMAATHGAIVGHDGTQVLNFVSTTDTPGDNEIPKYDSGTGKVTWEADVSAGSPVWSDIGDPTNSGLHTITFDNAETSLLTGDNDAAVSFFTLQNTDADHTGGAIYLLDLDFSADDGDVDANFILFQDAGGTVMSIQENGVIDTDGTITAGGAITATGSFIIGSADVNEAELEILDGATLTTSELNTPLDGALVTLTEFQELETIGATTISAAQWTGLGGATAAGIALWDDASAAAQLVTLGLSATASEINTPLDGASVTLTEFQELETIGATSISAGNWTGVSNLSNTNTGDEVAADLTTAGVIEIATGAETNTGTDPTRAVSPDGLDDWTGSAQVTTLGTIATGVWTGTSIADANVDNNITIDLATVATTVTITDNESTAEENPIVFVAGADPDGGNLGLETDGTTTYNPSTGTITATEFVGGGVGLTGVTASHAGTITWTGTSILESGAAFQFGDASDATLTHTYANTGTNVSIAYSTAAMAVTGALTATNLSGTNTGDQDARSKSISIESPTATEDITMFFTNVAITITEMRAVLNNGTATPSVTWTIRHNSDRSAAGAEVVTGGTTTTSVSTGSDVISFNDATIPADSFVWFVTTAQSGTVPNMSVTIIYDED